MSNILYPLRVLHGIIHEKNKVKKGAKDPFMHLEKKGLKIAASSKTRNHSASGIDGLAPWLIEIGEDCQISTNVTILAHDASTSRSTGYTMYGRVTLGDRVFIGHSSTIMPGVTIGNDVIIGCNSVVTKDIPSGCVYAGNPARFICSYDDFKMRKLKELNEVPCFEHNWKYWMNEATTQERQFMKEKMAEKRIAYIRSEQ